MPDLYVCSCFDFLVVCLVYIAAPLSFFCSCSLLFLCASSSLHQRILWSLRQLEAPDGSEGPDGRLLLQPRRAPHPGQTKHTRETQHNSKTSLIKALFYVYVCVCVRTEGGVPPFSRWTCYLAHPAGAHLDLWLPLDGSRCCACTGRGERPVL